jgi:hypothetical protein
MPARVMLGDEAEVCDAVQELNRGRPAEALESFARALELLDGVAEPETLIKL